MKTVKKLVASLVGGETVRHEAARARLRKALACESLEGRQLLNGSWAGFHADASAIGGTPADVHHWTKADPAGTHTFTPPTLSAAAQADMKTLQADQKTLEAELKADTTLTTLTDKVKADGVAIAKALGVTAPTDAGHQSFGFIKSTDASVAPGGMHGRPGPGAMGKGPALGTDIFRFGPGGPGGPGGSTTLPAALVTKLEAKGITADQISTFEADMKAVQTEIQSVDPTLQATIKTDQAAFAKVAPAPPMHFDHIMDKATASGTTTTTTA